MGPNCTIIAIKVNLEGERGFHLFLLLLSELHCAHLRQCHDCEGPDFVIPPKWSLRPPRLLGSQGTWTVTAVSWPDISCHIHSQHWWLPPWEFHQGRWEEAWVGWVSVGDIKIEPLLCKPYVMIALRLCLLRGFPSGVAGEWSLTFFYRVFCVILHPILCTPKQTTNKQKSMVECDWKILYTISFLYKLTSHLIILEISRSPTCLPENHKHLEDHGEFLPQYPMDLFF